MTRKLLIAGTIVTAVLALLLLGPLGANASVPAGIGTYSGYGYATGTHVIAGTSAFNNFQTGAVDSHFPLAKVFQDSSPSAYGTATYNDSGPIGATLHGCNDPTQKGCPPVPDVPYAHAQYPGGPADSHIDSANGKGPAPSRADAHADELLADASGVYAGGNPGQPFSGASGESHTVVNSDGSMVVRTHSFVANATFGAPPNAIVIEKVSVDITVTITNGVAAATASVKVGSFTVNGQASHLSDQGLTVGEQTVVPCSSSPLPPPPALPGANPPPAGSCTPQIETDNFRVYTVAPQKDVSGSHATVKASGVHVTATHPAPSGVPQQSVEYVFGEGYVDAGADAGLAADSGAAFLTSGFSLGDLGGGFGDNGFSMGDSSVNANNGTAAAIRHTAALLRANRQPLALLFLLWETLLMAGAAAWVWSRRVSAEEEELIA